MRDGKDVHRLGRSIWRASRGCQRGNFETDLYVTGQIAQGDGIGGKGQSPFRVGNPFSNRGEGNGRR
eukprot:scaffold61907_cov56-Attheya_sp.AAC.2